HRFPERVLDSHPCGSSLLSQFFADSGKRARQMRLHCAFAHPGYMCNLFQVQLVYVTEEKDCALAFAQIFDRTPDVRYLFPGQHTLFGGALTAGQPIAGYVEVHCICSRLTPELQASIAPMVFLKVDGNPHQPSQPARFSAEARPISMCL